MITGYLRSASTRQDDAEHSTDRGTAGAQEDMVLPLRDFRPLRRSNSQARQSSLQAMQRTHGNRAVQRYVQRSNWSRSRSSVPVQREEGGMWNYAKKLIGVDQIGPGIEELVGKAKSGYDWAEKGILDFLGGGGKSAGKGASEPEPGAGHATDQFEPYSQFELEDAMISSYSL